MNNTFKGAAAAAAGIALLAGGYGTFALWTDTANTPGGGVTSGNLDIAEGTTTWDDLSTVALGDWDPAVDHVVPGDTITMTKTFTISSDGKNMASKLTYTPGAIADADFATYLDVTTDVTGVTGGVLAGPNEWTFDSPTAPTEVTVTVTFDFDAATPGQVAQDVSASIAAGTLVFEQTA